MILVTQRQQVVDFIAKFPDRDDDEIAAALKFPQRQVVNMICRRLMAEGLLDRVIGVSGKLVNRLRADVSMPSAVTMGTEIEIAPKPKRPSLSVETLISAGFRKSAIWTLNKEGLIQIEGQLPSDKGVYAFASSETVFYVGVAGMGLKRRLYFYGKPGSRQTTNIRVNDLIRVSLVDGEIVNILTALPPDFEWGGLVVNGRAGLEVGLIESFYLPWNVRGTI
jgi:hypothetical protein